MGDVHRLRVNFNGDLPPDALVFWGKSSDFVEVVVIGKRRDGSIAIDYSRDDVAEVNLLLDRAKFSLIERGG